MYTDKDDRKSEIFHSPVKPNKIGRTFQAYLNAIMLTVVGFLVILMFMASMTKLTIGGDLNWKEVGVQSAFMYACSVSVHLILRSYGRRKGRETEGYKKARQEIESNNEQIIDCGFARFAPFYCRTWEEWDVDGVRERILAEVGIELEEFKKAYCRYDKQELASTFSDLTKGQKKAILRAKKVRRLRYDESYLSVSERHGIHRTSPSGGIKTRTVVKFQTAQVFLTTALTSLFSASIVAELIVSPTLATVVMCLVNVGTLLVFAVFGAISGYNLSASREVNEMVSRADEQRRFIKWCEEKPQSDVIRAEE